MFFFIMILSQLDKTKFVLNTFYYFHILPDGKPNSVCALYVTSIVISPKRTSTQRRLLVLLSKSPRLKAQLSLVLINNRGTVN